MSITTGPGGKETTHTWNGYTFNDLTAASQAKVEDITNWYGRPEFDDPRGQNTARRGEHVLPGTTKGKTVVFEGTIRARSMAEWQQQRRAMSAACLGTDVNLLTTHGDPDWTVLARVIDVSIDEKPDWDLNRWWPFQGEFSVSFRMEDGRFMALPKNVFADLASGYTAHCVNSGTGDAEPDFAITGITGALTLQNMTTGKQLVFAGLPDGDMLVSFHNRSALMLGDDMTGFLNPGSSSWWDELVPGLIPGDNQIKVTGGVWTVGWYHTDI